MNQRVWGPKLWFSLHSITFTYPYNPSSEDKKTVSDFFVSLKDVLPCTACQTNYKKNLADFPIKLDSRKELVYWLINLHNNVNKETGKKKWSYKDVIRKYEREYGCKIYLTEEEEKLDNDSGNNCLTGKLYNYRYICVVMLILCIVVYYYHFKN
jgi:hypothetical protein